MPNGLAFVHAMLVFAGAFAALVGVGLLMAETAPPAQLVRARRRLGESWRALGLAAWRRVPGCLTGWLADGLERLVRAGFTDADRRMAFGGMVMALTLVLVPAAALINALFGGRPFLFGYYLALLAALAWLNFVGETGRLRPLNGLAAAFLGISLTVIIPVYLVHSFTEVTIHNVFSHGVLKSLLVAVFWYVAAYGAGLVLGILLGLAGVDPARAPVAGFAHAFLAAVPASFVLTFVALLVGHFAVLEQNPARSWRLVLWATGLTSLAFALTLRLMAWGRTGGGGRLSAAYAVNLIAAAVLSVLLAKGAYSGAAQPMTWAEAAGFLAGQAPDRAGVHLGSGFWVSHLPFLPLVAFVLAVAVGLVSRAAAGLFDRVGGADARPFLTSAAAAGGVALLFWAAAAV